MSKDTGKVLIHGKAYETVASRVSRFRESYPEYTIMTKIVKIDADECIIEAAILNETGRLIANGHAQELKIASQINKTSYVENCETSAIGRALAAFGLAGTEYASANEVQNAIHQQNNPVTGRAAAALKPQRTTEEYLKEITSAQNEDELKAAYSKIYGEIKSNAPLLAAVDKVKDDMKSLFAKAE